MSKPQRIHESPYGPLSVPTNVSVAQFLAKYNPDDVPGDKVICSDFDNPESKITFGSVRTDPGRGATGLVNVLGIKEKDVVCMFGLNSVNWILLAHSILWTGAVYAGINAAATSYELVHYFAISRPSVVAVDIGLRKRVEDALRMSKDLGDVKVLLIEDGTGDVAVDDYPCFPRDIMKFTSGRPPQDLTYRDNRDVPAAMCFSSGTSGRPKGVLLTHSNLIAYALALRVSNPLLANYRQTEIFFPPFAHIYGIGVGTMSPALTGQHVIAMKKFEFLPYLRKCAEVQATIVRCVPAIAIQLLKDPASKQMDLTSINTVFVAGASLPVEVSDGLAKMLKGCVVLDGIGKPSAGHQVRIVNEQYQDVEVGVHGECLVRGATTFKEYYNNPEATKESFHDGWLCTGDTISIDDDGFMWFHGRSKELIKYKGNQVPPAELEDVLLSHEDVNEAGVCGTFDEKLETEVPVGYINFTRSVPEKERQRLLDEIKTWANKRMASHKRLRGGLFFLDSLPKNATGKLMRRDLPAAKQQQKPAKL